jgi:hypothetical protein
MEVSHATNGTHVDSEENSKIQPKKKMKYRGATVNMEGPAYPSRGRKRPHLA